MKKLQKKYILKTLNFILVFGAAILEIKKIKCNTFNCFFYNFLTLKMFKFKIPLLLFTFT